MRVGEVMTRDVQTCSAAEPLNVAAGVMRELDCGVVPVLGADRLVAGVVTDRDICMAALSFGRTLREISVGEAMTEDVLTCRVEDTIEAAERIMRAGSVRRLPVVSGPPPVFVSAWELPGPSARKGSQPRSDLPPRLTTVPSGIAAGTAAGDANPRWFARPARSAPGEDHVLARRHITCVLGAGPVRVASWPGRHLARRTLLPNSY